MMKYSNNSDLDALIALAVTSIENGNLVEGLSSMLKNQPTHILAASELHEEPRYRIGSKLVTYNGVSEDGMPIQETWGGGVAEIKADSVILSNKEPLKFPKGHPQEGEVVRGTYSEDGIFVVDSNGTDILCNEYVSDREFVKGAYGIDASENWQIGLKLAPSYVMQIPEELDSVAIITGSGIEINLTGGDYVIVDVKKGKVSSVHGIERSWLDKTYVDLDTYRASLD